MLLPRRWNAEAAARVYQGPIFRTLRRNRGKKKTYKVIEDNDPTGFKSRKACDAKAKLGIMVEQFPRYSPDLNPLDYSLWTAVGKRMEENEPKKVETNEAYKKRLRRTALRMPRECVLKAVASMKTRAKAVVLAKGRDVPRD